MIKTLFFDVGYTLVDEEAVWLRRCKEQAATEEAKKLGVTAEDIYHEIEKVTIEGLPQYRTTPQDAVAAANPPDYEVDNLIELLRIF